MTVQKLTGLPLLPNAACRDTKNPEAWFSFNPRVTEQARDICRRCPEIRDCLAWAITHDEAGLWAGTTDEQRSALKRRHTTLELT